MTGETHLDTDCTCHVLSGDKLASVDTATMKNSEACVSPCGRFVAVSGELQESYCVN